MFGENLKNFFLWSPPLRFFFSSFSPAKTWHPYIAIRYKMIGKNSFQLYYKLLNTIVIITQELKGK